MRIYKTIVEALDETARDIKVRSITTECKSYQDKKLEGKERFVKELIGVDFKIDKPLLNRDDAIRYMFRDPEEAEKIINYCKQEIKDRCSGEPLNPGNSYKIRADMWNKFLEGTGKFSYQYAERLWTNDQFKSVINCLKNDAGTRQAVLSVWNPDKDMNSKKLGGVSRVPCSLNYQFLIRNNRLHCIYSMRSNDFFGHHVIDLYCASGLMEYVTKALQSTYPGLKIGSLSYVCGSLHAFRHDIDNWVLF
jgi:thymidylate synthase